MKTQKLKKGDKAEVITDGSGCEHYFKKGQCVTFVETTIMNKIVCYRFVDENGVQQYLIEKDFNLTPAPKRANTNQKSNKMTQTETGKFQTRITDEKTLTRYAKFMKRNKIGTRSQLVAEALREYVRNNS